MKINKETEHLETRNKEASRWLADNCRICKHQRYYHLVDYSGFGGKYIHANCNFVIKKYGFCECSEWMPPDNLDYIELLAKKKGLISDDEKGEEEK